MPASQREALAAISISTSGPITTALTSSDTAVDYYRLGIQNSRCTRAAGLGQPVPRGKNGDREPDS